MGTALGAILGPLCSWLVGVEQFLVAGLISAPLGMIVGLGFGAVHRQRRRNFTDTSLGVNLCTALPLVLTALVMYSMTGAVAGKLSGYVAMGAAFAGPMTGMLIGSLVDRFYETYLVRRAREPLNSLDSR